MSERVVDVDTTRGAMSPQMSRQNSDRKMKSPKGKMMMDGNINTLLVSKKSSLCCIFFRCPRLLRRVMDCMFKIIGHLHLDPAAEPQARMFLA